MLQVNIYEAKTQLSKLLRRVQAGGDVVIADAGRPVARLVPFMPAGARRVLGEDVGKVWIADDFDAPLPDATIEPFYAGTKPVPVVRAKATRTRGRAKPAKSSK